MECTYTFKAKTVLRYEHSLLFIRFLLNFMGLEFLSDFSDQIIINKLANYFLDRPLMTHFCFQTSGDYRVIALLFTDGVLNWLQNIIAFSVLSLVTPLTYAVASASKRIFVIAISLLILGNPVTWMNMFGMLLAIIGVLCYNRVSIYLFKKTQ